MARGIRGAIPRNVILLLLVAPTTQGQLSCGTDPPNATLLGPTTLVLSRGFALPAETDPGVNVTDDISGAAQPTFTVRTDWVGPCSNGTFPEGTVPNDTATECPDPNNLTACTCDQGNHRFSATNAPGFLSEGGTYFKRYVATDVPYGLTGSAIRRVVVTERHSTGATGCKCLNETAKMTSLPIANSYEVRSGTECLVISNSSTADQYCYPAIYGLQGCRSYDESLVPVCNDGYGNAAVGRGSWCAVPWCYVDPASCSSAYGATASAYFDGMYYSYSTCGQGATYEDVDHKYIRSAASESSTKFATEGIMILTLGIALAVGVALVVYRYVRTVHRRERPADFRKIIRELTRSEAAARSQAHVPIAPLSLDFRLSTNPHRGQQAEEVSIHPKLQPTGSKRGGLHNPDSKRGALGTATRFWSWNASHNDSDDDINVPLELKRSHVLLEDVLGAGHFGQVCRGSLTTNVGKVKHVVQVAVKLVQESYEGVMVSASVQRDFLEEACITWQFEHDNVVQMYGVVTSGFPYLLVLELCQNGELLEYISSRDHVPTDVLMGMLRDIASGMTYLAGRRFVHRDLAARNILLDKDLRAKICDFGLGRHFQGGEYYTMMSDMMLPLRWTDPWALESQKFSEASDVWSFGVTAIEIFSGGARPYDPLPNYFVLSSLKDGYRHPKPEAMPTEVYDNIVLPCWLYSDTMTSAGEKAATADRGHEGNTAGLPSTMPWGGERITFADLYARLDAMCHKYKVDVTLVDELQRGDDNRASYCVAAAAAARLSPKESLALLNEPGGTVFAKSATNYVTIMDSGADVQPTAKSTVATDGVTAGMAASGARTWQLATAVPHLEGPYSIMALREGAVVNPPREAVQLSQQRLRNGSGVDFDNHGAVNGAQGWVTSNELDFGAAAPRRADGISSTV
mmetsp:Transcript_34054/g.102666  ORF Transcript_34054/g.102666 Transcript_34054/m.102666 type:complete len:914 (+) Transcript_34054:84-2825(+)